MLRTLGTRFVRSAKLNPLKSYRPISVAVCCLRDAGSSSSNMGITKQLIKAGDGVTFPKRGQRVTVHYTGTLNDPSGNKFDSSRDRGQKFTFQIGMGQVIKGWDEGVAEMSIGERAYLTCSPDYAYGARGYPPVIPANATLCFDVELFSAE